MLVGGDGMNECFDDEYWEHHAKEQLLKCKGCTGCPVTYYPLATIVGYGLECECVEVKAYDTVDD